MKFFIASMFLAALGSTHVFANTTPAHSSEPESILACWDSTFAYNVFRVEQTDKHFYLSVNGSTLTDPGESFTLYNAAGMFTYKGWTNRLPLTIPFERDECAWDEATQTLTCTAGHEDAYEQHEEIYVANVIDDLGETKYPISLYKASHLHLTASPEGMVLTHTRRYGDGSVDAQSLAVRRYIIGEEPVPLVCDLDAGNAFLDIKAPRRLIDHLEP